MVGKKIEQIFLKSELTTREFAEKIGSSAPNLKNLFEKDYVSTKYLEAISKNFNVPISHFFSDDISFDAPEETSSLRQQIKELKAEKERLYSMLENFSQAYTMLAGKLEGSDDWQELLPWRIAA